MCSRSPAFVLPLIVGVNPFIHSRKRAISLIERVLSVKGMLRQLWRFKINRLRTRSGMKLIEHVAAQMGGIKNERHVHG